MLLFRPSLIPNPQKRTSKTNYAESSDDEDIKLRAPKRRRRQTGASIVNGDDEDDDPFTADVDEVSEDGWFQIPWNALNC